MEADMDLRAVGDSESRFSACVEGLERDWSRGPRQPIARLLPRPDDAVRAQERRADGGGDGAWTDGSTASVAAAFRWQRGVVGRKGFGQDARHGAAGD